MAGRGTVVVTAVQNLMQRGDSVTDHSSSRTTTWAKALVALMMALLAFATTAGTAGAATGGSHPDFSAQARGLGLTSAQARSLQSRADGYLAKTGGTQVAVNKIALAGGGVLLLTLPGEQRARDLAAHSSALLAASCPYTYVCAYSAPNFQGDSIQLFTCNTLTSIPWVDNGSWINNQRSTLYARFYRSDYTVGWTSPGGYSSDPNAPWSWVYYLSPC